MSATAPLATARGRSRWRGAGGSPHTAPPAKHGAGGGFGPSILLTRGGATLADGETTRQLKNPPPHNLLVSNVGKPFGEWVLAGNNDGTNHQPGYAGHIPGLRDRPVGSTFGHSTSPGIFNESDRASSMKIERIPKSSYHSGLRMSDKAKAKITSVKSGAKHWSAPQTAFCISS